MQINGPIQPTSCWLFLPWRCATLCSSVPAGRPQLPRGGGRVLLPPGIGEGNTCYVVCAPPSRSKRVYWDGCLETSCLRGISHGRCMTEADTTGIFFKTLPQSLHPLGTMPGAVFHNQVNQRQSTFPPSLTPTQHTTLHLLTIPGFGHRAQTTGALLCV